VRTRVLLTICLAISGAFGQGGGSARAPLSDSAIEDGRAIFNQTCTACHGIDGQTGDRGPAMFGERRFTRVTEQQIFQAIKEGIGSDMPPMGLSDEDTGKVVAFIRSLRANAVDVPVRGDIAAGEVIFWGKGACSRCHAVRGQGGLLGPDLSNLGAEMPLARIREALTVAKPHVPAGYRPVQVTTRTGRTLSGIAKNEHNFSLQMLADDNRLHTFTGAEIESLSYAEQSLMPSDYDQRLTAEEFQNLLAFLSRLARPAASDDARATAGPPD